MTYSPSPNPSHQGRGVFVQTLVNPALRDASRGLGVPGRAEVYDKIMKRPGNNVGTGFGWVACRAQVFRASRMQRISKTLDIIQFFLLC